MKSSELRQKYLDFFKGKEHKIIPSASLIPENDPTVLFATAGMHPLVPFLLGEKHPQGKRLASCQKCIRTGDIDDVGDDTHLTFFEMLGNWSLGDYWKEDAIKWSFEFLTKELKLPLEKLAFTCFAGDGDAPKDEESAKIWESLGVPKNRIYFLPKKDNWWGPAGRTGPCGPDTEMFYWAEEGEPAKDISDKRWVEIWNDVFMQYVKDEKGNYNPAKQKNVDTGMGLERTLAALNGKENVYETDLFLPLVQEIEKLSSWKVKPSNAHTRIIADHIKASVFLASEGIVPSNVDRGYILRRLIRRAIRLGKILQMPKDFLTILIKIVVGIYKGAYPELEKNEREVISVVRQEAEKFEETLEKGLKEFEKIDFWLRNETGAQVSSHNNRGTYVAKRDVVREVYPGLGKKLFFLFQTYGFPLELSLEELESQYGEIFRFKEIITKSFKEELEKHQELSRTASAGMFKGGLADASLETTKLHTAAHLMLAGLRKVLGNNIVQKGSNITAERLRFDFSHKEKMTGGQIKDVENFVNGIIEEDLPVTCEEMTLEKAKELNAMGVFESKYGDKVKVYTIGSGENVASREICGGPHIERTGVLGHFRIQKEESSSSGVRRIKAALE